MYSGGTSSAQQAQFDAFFAEEGDGISGGSLSGSIGSSQTTQPTSLGVAASQPNTNGAVVVPLWRRCCFMLAIETYQPYFDVDTVDVRQRIINSVKFFNETDGFWNKVLPRTNVHQTVPNDLPYPGQAQQQAQLASVENKPDVYAPFWMATTLILCVSITSNLQNYLNQVNGYQENFDYDVKVLVRALWVLYGYIFAIPLFFFLVIRCLLQENKENMTRRQFPSYVELVSLYGYSLPPFFLGVIICGILPFHPIQWLALLSSTLVSLIFILRNLVSSVMGSYAAHASHLPVALSDDDGFGTEEDEAVSSRTRGIYAQRAKGGPILGSIICIHLIFCMLLKFGFYHQYN